MSAMMNRRAMLGVSAASAAALCLPAISSAKQPKTKMKTFTYKTVGDLEIKADVHRADDNKTRPVLVWFHGGALIVGHRGGVSGRVLKDMLGAGYTVVSFDYRLAPETKLPEIIADLEDGFTWLHEKGPELFNVDTSKVAVSGGSAGGCLTLVSGFRAKPRPTVLVPYWGYGDLIGDWIGKPSPHERHQTKFTKEEAYAQVGDGPIADSRESKKERGAFYQYCRQQGIWPKEVAGWDHHREPEKFYPYMTIKNVTKEYPPTLMVHGTKDTDVPYEQSTMLAEQFQQHGVEHKLVTIPNGEHGLVGGDPKLIDDAYGQAFAFIHDKMC
ncbi:alpha/beta hydrolase [Gimesia fumaroli]|uniref:Lipase 2 n=1 Tax=Gimesia fumaroli TaxID=2527976 RepID=A0A518I6I5_9PLAN|nr:alpha/beta hydrolase [Gimesia fumaroli]QDV48717.1 Lipase 2 [Gimesia fumaroli]